MCHTNYMKKSVLLFLPILALLAGCSIKVDYLNNEHSAGLEKSIDNSKSKEISYAYFSGDNLEKEGLNVARFTFNIDKTDSNISKENLPPIITCDNTDITYTIEDAQYVGSKEGIGLFIGIDSKYIDGSLNIGFDRDIKCVEIKATRYFYETQSFETNIVIDSDAAIAVNESRYIKLSGSKDESGLPTITECRYNLSNNARNVNVKVGPQRAFIQEIACYF